MGTYLMMLYVSLEQEKAVKNLFNSKGWGFKKPDLSMTTDKLGPTYTSIDDNESESEGETTSKGRTRSRPATREASKRTPAVKIIKQSPKSEKKTSKVRVQLRKGGKKSTENAEFQEILEEAELITASINPADDEGEGEEIEPFTVKVERDGNMGEDSDYEGEDGESNDEDMDDDFDDVTPSTSYLEAGAESTDISQETADTPKPAKRRKVTTKARERPTLPPVDMDDLEAMGDLSPIKDDGDDSTPYKQYDTIKEENSKIVYYEPSDVKEEDSSLKGLNLKKDSSAKKTKPVPSKGSASEENLQKHLCSECGKSYKSKNSLKRHLLVHSGSQSLCYICAKQFADKDQVKRHIETTHHGVRYQCDQCGQSYKSKCGLENHKSAHSGIYKISCSLCSQGFNYKASYEDHMDYHDGIKRHKCVKCETFFYSRTNMKRHFLGCGKSGKSFGCKTCGKYYKTEQNLKEHIQQAHENDSVWSCSCGAVFQHRTSLCRHRAKTGHEHV